VVARSDVLADVLDGEDPVDRHKQTGGGGDGDRHVGPDRQLAAGRYILTRGTTTGFDVSTFRRFDVSFYRHRRDSSTFTARKRKNSVPLRKKTIARVSKIPLLKS